MDNKEFHEEEVLLPQEPEALPEDLSQEETPVIEELTFAPEEPQPEAAEPEEAPAEPLFQDLPLSQPEPEAAEEAAPQADSLDHELLEDPQVGQELHPDDHAMDFHGILNHGEEEPPFDPAILDHPDLEETPEEETPSEEPQEEPAELLPDLPPEPPADQDYRENDPEFQTIFETPVEAAPAVPSRKRPTRKGRPKRKKGEGLLGIPNILATFVWLALILAIGVTAGRMLWICAADVLAFGREDKPVTITIYASDDMDSITDKLHSAGLIRYKSLFNLYADISDAQEDIKPGIYDLNTRYDYHALVNFMSPRSSREVIELTIPEGYTCAQIFALLEENRVCTAIDAAAWAATGELDDYWFLEDLPRGAENCLEGFLFPDTYEFYKNSSPREALQRMLNNFEIKFNEEMRAQISSLNDRFGSSYGVREVAIVASLIEKESAAPAESAKVAGVIYNRLHNWDAPAYLNIDAAIVYAQGGDAETIDTSLDSPYNTYRNVGLTPGPIANPGLSSLQAALNPDSHSYYYYVLNPATGMHTFSETQAEHDGYIAEYYG